MNTSLKWALGTAVAGIALAAIFVPKDDPLRGGPRTRSDSLMVAWNLERMRYSVLSRAVGRGEAAELARTAGTVPTATPLVRVSREIHPQTAQLIEERVRAEFEAIRAVPSRYPVAVLAMVDSSLAAGGVYTQSLVLPTRDGDPCVVVLRLPRHRKAAWFPVSTARLLGTCAYYAAFGAPGAGTRDWLVETRGITARYLQPPPAHAALNERRPRVSVANYGFSPIIVAMLRCRLGETDGCDAFLGPESTDPRYDELVYRVTIDRSVLRTAFPGTDVFRSAVWSEDYRFRGGMLAEFVAEVGPDRFRELWADPRGIQAAYQAGTGKPFSTWLTDYFVREVDTPNRGPNVPPLGVWFPIALITALLAVTASRSPRRMG